MLIFSTLVQAAVPDAPTDAGAAPSAAATRRQAVDSCVNERYNRTRSGCAAEYVYCKDHGDTWSLDDGYCVQPRGDGTWEMVLPPQPTPAPPAPATDTEPPPAPLALASADPAPTPPPAADPDGSAAGQSDANMSPAGQIREANRAANLAIRQGARQRRREVAGCAQWDGMNSLSCQTEWAACQTDGAHWSLDLHRCSTQVGLPPATEPIIVVVPAPSPADTVAATATPPPVVVVQVPPVATSDVSSAAAPTPMMATDPAVAPPTNAVVHTDDADKTPPVEVDPLVEAAVQSCSAPNDADLRRRIFEAAYAEGGTVENCHPTKDGYRWLSSAFVFVPEEDWQRELQLHQGVP